MVFFVMGSFPMDALQDSQAGLGVIGIKCNRTLVISTLHPYDRMASYLAPYGNSEALKVARSLDLKVETLLIAAGDK